jgi:hypothetical protein
MPQPAAHRPAPPASESGAAPWWWLLAGLGLLLVLGVAAVMLRRGRGGDLSRRAAVPVVERPQPVAPVMPAAPAMPAAPGVPMPPSSPAAPPPPLQITLVPRRMDLTLVNAALTWRVDLTNLGPTPLAGLAVAADMISAHAGLTEQERSAGPDADSASVAVGTLEPGQSGTASGEIRLPFPRIQPIWHGEIALFMPLCGCAWRVTASGRSHGCSLSASHQQCRTAPCSPFGSTLGRVSTRIWRSGCSPEAFTPPAPGATQWP